MDSRGMNRRRFHEKPGAKPPKIKVYCILEKDGYIYFPVAAQYSPYSLYDGDKAESYLAGMPNFFGGNMEERESIEEALAREIKEESQERIILNIPNKLETPIFAALLGQDTYKFYVLKPENCNIEKFVWGDDNVIQLCPFEKIEGRSKDYCAQYEDSFLVRMDKERFCGFIRQLKEVDIEREGETETVRGLLGELGIGDCATKESIKRWYDSHTFTAFAAAPMKL